MRWLKGAVTALVLWKIWTYLDAATLGENYNVIEAIAPVLIAAPFCGVAVYFFWLGSDILAGAQAVMKVTASLIAGAISWQALAVIAAGITAMFLWRRARGGHGTPLMQLRVFNERGVLSALATSLGVLSWIAFGPFGVFTVMTNHGFVLVTPDPMLFCFVADGVKQCAEILLLMPPTTTLQLLQALLIATFGLALAVRCSASAPAE